MSGELSVTMVFLAVRRDLHPTAPGVLFEYDVHS
jgi:hypothetical protein